MKLTESHLRNLIKQELKRFLNISESQDNKPRRYSPQEMEAIYDQIITNWEKDDEEEFGITEKIKSQSVRSLKEKLARLARK